MDVYLSPDTAVAFTFVANLEIILRDDPNISRLDGNLTSYNTVSVAEELKSIRLDFV